MQMLSKYFFNLCLFLSGAVVLVLPSGYSIGFYLLCLVSLGLWIKYRGYLISKDSKSFLWPLFSYAVGQCALALHEKWAAREIENYLPYLLVAFGLWGVRRYKPKANYLWTGLAIGALGAAVFSGYQALGLGLRAGGFTHSIQFGNIALMMGVLCLVRALVVFEFTWFNALMGAGFLAGMSSSVWSQTRGGWLALLIIFSWILATATRGWPTNKRALCASVFVLFLSVPIAQTGGVVQSRIYVAVEEFQSFFIAGKQDTSVGARLAMWNLAVGAIADKPILGHGDAGWIELRDGAIADGRLSSFSSTFTHLHNDFLNVAFKRGLVGLILFLTLYLVPMLLFFKPYLSHMSADVRALAMGGMLIPMMYMDFGLTQTFLSHNSGRIVLCSLWMCFAGLMLNAVQSQICNSKE